MPETKSALNLPGNNRRLPAAARTVNITDTINVGDNADSFGNTFRAIYATDFVKQKPLRIIRQAGHCIFLGLSAFHFIKAMLLLPAILGFIPATDGAELNAPADKAEKVFAENYAADETNTHSDDEAQSGGGKKLLEKIDHKIAFQLILLGFGTGIGFIAGYKIAQKY